MEKENCTASDVLADLFGPTCSMDSPPKKGKRKGSSDLDDEASPPKVEKRQPLSPIKNNVASDEGYDEPAKKHIVKKKLFDTEENKVETPKKQRTKTNADFAKIKARLSLENPGIILGREKEQAEVEDFINESIENERPGSMYISGQPGTGKSASINNILDQINVDALGAHSGITGSRLERH